MCFRPFLGFWAKNLKVQKNQLLSDKIKILRVFYFLKLLKIHNIGYSNRSKCLFLKVVCHFSYFGHFSLCKALCKTKSEFLPMKTLTIFFSDYIFGFSTPKGNKNHTYLKQKWIFTILNTL